MNGFMKKLKKRFSFKIQFGHIMVIFVLFVIALKFKDNIASKIEGISGRMGETDLSPMYPPHNNLNFE